MALCCVWPKHLRRTRAHGLKAEWRQDPQPANIGHERGVAAGGSGDVRPIAGVFFAVCPPSTSLQDAQLLELQISSCTQECATHAQPCNRSRARGHAALGDPFTLPQCLNSPFRVCLELGAQKACSEALHHYALSPTDTLTHTDTRTHIDTHTRDYGCAIMTDWGGGVGGGGGG